MGKIEKKATLSYSTLVKKLLLKPNYRIAIAGAPQEFSKNLGELPDGARISSRLTGSNDIVLLFAPASKDFEKKISVAAASLKPGGILWVAYPKQTGNVQTDLNRDILREAASKHGLKAVSLVALDSTWSAMRFKPV